LQVAAQLKIASEWLGGDRLKTHAEGYFSRHPAADVPLMCAPPLARIPASAPCFARAKR